MVDMGLSGRGEWERDPLSPRTGRHSVIFSFCADDWDESTSNALSTVSEWVVTVSAPVGDELGMR